MTKADVAGTEFLLSAEAGRPVGKAIARQRQYRNFIDAGRTLACHPTMPLAKVGVSGEAPDKRSTKPMLSLEAREALVFLLQYLTPAERLMFRLIVGEGLGIKGAAAELGMAWQTLQYKWNKVRSKAAEIIGSNK